MTSTIKQLPESDETFLDHVGWMISDIKKASEAFDRLGFIMTPYSEHTNKNQNTGEITLQGSANRLIMLETGYLELLTDVAGINTPVSENLHSSMKRYVGVHLVAFSVADAHIEASRLSNIGYELQPTVNLRRTIEAADGSQTEVAFSVIRPKFGSIAEGRIQSLTHHTPQHMWQERYVHHDNAITALTGVVFCVADPKESAERFVKYTDHSLHSSASDISITTDRGRVIFTDEDRLSDSFPGVTSPDLPSIPALILASHDLAKTRAFFKNRKIELLEDGANRLIIHPKEAMGSALVIEPGNN